MILTGNEDLRVKKTITGIKTAFESLICEKEYDRITVKELCDRAQVNKKTFYHYYETLDALLAFTRSTTLVWFAFPISEIVIFAMSLAFLKNIYMEQLGGIHLQVRLASDNM